MNAQEILNTLANKDIYISCGYGGVLFVEVGAIVEYEYGEGKASTQKVGDYRLFCDETWTFSDGKNINLNRWTSVRKEIDDIFESLGVQRLERIEVINSFEKTIFYISGGYILTILRDDAIDTFSLIMNSEQKKLLVFGNGKFEFADYQADTSYLKKRKARPALTQTVNIERDFLRNQSADLLPISYAKATEFIHPIVNQKIQKIEIDSGTQFTLSFGETQSNSSEPIQRWDLRVEELWILKKGNEVVQDVRTERFHFEEKLNSLLQNKHVLEMRFDKNGSQTVILFDEGYSLTLLETNRYSRWNLHDFTTGLSVVSYAEQGLAYRIGSPSHLSELYKTGDVHLDAILYELKFYRNYFAGGKK